MKINITEEHILQLFLDNKISLDDIDIQDRKNFINNNANRLLKDGFKNKNFKQLEILFSVKEIQDIFFKEINSLVKTANINYIENLPQNNFITDFIWSMSRQDFAEKKSFFRQINVLVLEHKEEMKDFFALRTSETNSGFRKYQPLGLFYLRVVDMDVELLLNKDIISVDLFSPNTKDTIGHCLYQYSFETNQIIIDKIEKKQNLVDFLCDKNDSDHTPIDKLCSDLRNRNIDTLEYLFLEKLDIKVFKKDFLNYVIKCSNILKNKQTKLIIRERIFQSLDVLFNMGTLQSDSELKQEVGKTLSNKCEKEIHYLWLSAKLQPKGILEKKKPKI